MSKTIISKVNGVGKKKGSISKNVLIRNVMDIISGRDYSFDECLEFAEQSNKQTLMNFLRDYDLADDYEAVIESYMENFLNA